jgi:hypothetical protein
MNLFSQLLSKPQSPTVGKNTLDQIVTGLKQWRERDYLLWVKQIQTHFPELPIRNQILCGDGDLAANVFQLVWGCWFICQKQYLQPPDTGQFCALLYSPLVQAHGETKVAEYSSRYVDKHSKEFATNNRRFCWDILDFMVGPDQSTYLARLSMAATVKYFTDPVYLTMAQAFGDEKSTLFFSKRMQS